MAQTTGQLQQAKERARTRLADGYAQDLLDQEQLDERLEGVERARTVDEVHALLVDMAEPEPMTALVPVSTAAPQKIGALLGSIERHGAWTVAARMQVRAVLGSVVLDLRGATLPDGPIELHATVVLGNLEVIVPPGWRVDNDCAAVLATVEQFESHRSPTQQPRVLKIRGRVVLGGLEVFERLPGESRGEARKRRRRERKELVEQQAKALSRGRE